jgi:hypothetical protein
MIGRPLSGRKLSGRALGGRGLSSRSGGGGGASGFEPPPSITLSANSIAEDASVNDVIGTLAVANGSGSYTFTITADPDSKFQIANDDELQLADTLDYETATSHLVTIEADNGVDDPISRQFTINVTEFVVAGLSDNTGVALYAPFSGPDNATAATDHSQHAHDLTFVGDAKITDNKLALDGTGDYVSIPNSPAFYIAADEDFTIKARVKLTALTGFATIMSLWHAPNNRRSWALFAIDNGTTFVKVLRFSSSTDGLVGGTIETSSANDTVPIGTEFEARVTREAGVITAYVDGVQVFQLTRAVAFYQNVADVITIGAASNGLSLVNGTIDDVQFIKGTALEPP